MTRTEAMSVTEKLFGEPSTWSIIAQVYFQSLSSESLTQTNGSIEPSNKIMSRLYPLNLGNDNDRISGI